MDQDTFRRMNSDISPDKILKQKYDTENDTKTEICYIQLLKSSIVELGLYRDGRYQLLALSWYIIIVIEKCMLRDGGGEDMSRIFWTSWDW